MQTRTVPVGHSFHMQCTRTVLDHMRGLCSKDTFKGLLLYFYQPQMYQNYEQEDILSVDRLG